MKIAVTGGRDHESSPEEVQEFEELWWHLGGDLWSNQEQDFHYGLVGDARGVDAWFKRWYMEKYGMEPWVFVAEWNKYGKSAGSMRNQKIQDCLPDVTIAFSGGNGTVDHVERALRRGGMVIGIGDGGRRVIGKAREKLA